ncbi:MAG: HEPN domain-containing protein [Pirellulaceae bacterium]
MPKTSPSKAYLRFEGVVRRSLNILTLQSAVANIWQVTTPETTLDLSDMGRAAVVLAVAAMDSYFTDVFVERLVPFIKKKGATKDLVKLLGEAGLDTECALQLIVLKSPFRKIRRLVESHLDKMTTQKFEVIDKLFGIYHFKDFTSSIAKYSKKGDRLLISIRKLVQRRHMIVHEGDVNSHGQPREADPAEFQRRIGALILFVSKADELLHKQLR